MFGEHFQVVDQSVHIKIGEELSAIGPQSPDDPEAADRGKASKSQRGYVSILSETCDPENPLQFITKVQMESGNSDNAQMLMEILPNLKERTDLDHSTPMAGLAVQKQTRCSRSTR